MRRVFETVPRKIVVIEFKGEEIPNYPWLKVCGTKLQKKERSGKFWNKLHDTELEVEYGDFVVMHNLDDLYPIKKEVLFQNYREY